MVVMVFGVAIADINQVVSFSDNNWNCADYLCTSHVKEGEYQPNYQCAEFVSRSLVAGGYITGIAVNDTQTAYEYYRYKSNTYDLLWVSSKQGGPLGLEDLLKILGWKAIGSSSSQVNAGIVLMLVGSDGDYSHTAIGVGKDSTDAHNMAHYHQPASVYEGINQLYQPPNQTEVAIASP